MTLPTVAEACHPSRVRESVVWPRLRSASPSMAKLEHFDWTARVTFTCYGLRVGIRATDARVLDELGEYLPPPRRPARHGAVDRLYSFVAGGEGTHPRARRYHRVFS